MATQVQGIQKKMAAGFFCAIILVCCQTTLAQEGPDLQTTFDIPSSFNPVGSGARALGMGSAFIAVADDATAASWNPGGLTQLDIPEISVVGAYLYRVEDLEFGTNPEADGRQTVSEVNLNYLSIAYPFSLFDRNMIVSINYQQLFDFYRDWEFTLLNGPARPDTRELNVNFEQDGNIYALGVAYAMKIFPRLSFGFTLNFWEDFLDDNEWTKKTRETEQRTFPLFPEPVLIDRRQKETFSFSGFNFNLGLLWNVTSKLTLGAVFRSPFTADLDYRLDFEGTARSISGVLLDDAKDTFREDQDLDMPMSYGVGMAFRPSDQLTLSADVSRTHWQDFILEDEDGNKTSPISGLPKSQSDVDPTIQVRLGAEYLLIRPKFVIPLRGGLFYDPVPAEGSPDDFYGLSIGSGISIRRASFDIAYQYRFGRDVGRDAGGSNLQELDFSQDVDEHKVYASVIIYF